MNRRLLLSLYATAMVASGAANAQPAPSGQAGPARLRGTIDAVSADAMDVTLRGGAKVHVLLPAALRTTYVVNAKLSDIQPNSYIGTAAAPQPDGTLKALEVHVFPPSMRGSGEGFRPFDLEPGSTMTNGTVGSLVGTSDRIATVKYAEGEKKILIPDDVPVVSFEPTDRSALTAGAKVIVSGQRATDGGPVTAASINIGKDGLTPPM